MLKCFPRVSKTIDVIRKIKELCLRGRFNLRKLICNNDKVMRLLPQAERTKDDKEEHLKFGL